MHPSIYSEHFAAGKCTFLHSLQCCNSSLQRDKKQETVTNINENIVHFEEATCGKCQLTARRRTLFTCVQVLYIVEKGWCLDRHSSSSVSFTSCKIWIRNFNSQNQVKFYIFCIFFLKNQNFHLQKYGIFICQLHL